MSRIQKAIATRSNCEKAELSEMTFHVVESNRNTPFSFLVTCFCVVDAADIECFCLATLLWGTEAGANTKTQMLNHHSRDEICTKS